MSKKGDRVFGHYEAESMFDTISRALTDTDHPSATALNFLYELKAERLLLLAKIALRDDA